MEFVEFLNHAWFTRIWVVQEVAVASVVQIAYGGRYLNWDMMESVFEIFTEPEMSALLQMTCKGRQAVRNVTQLSTIGRIRQNTEMCRRLDSYENTTKLSATILHVLDFENKAFENLAATSNELRKTLSLSRLLTDCVNFQATDARDKVFALLGLATDKSTSAIASNYQFLSTKDVFIQAGRYILSTSDPLAVLPFAGIGFPGRQTNLPSWVPDWIHCHAGCRLASPRYNNFNTYRASGNQSPTISLGSSDVLTLGCIIVDKITLLGLECNTRFNDDNFVLDATGNRYHRDEWSANYYWHKEALELALRNAQDPYRFKSGQSLYEVFWRTLIGDIVPTTRPAPAALGDYYHEWTDLLEFRKPYFDESASDASSALPLPSDYDYWNRIRRSTEWGLAIGLCSSGRRLCTTAKGYIGIVPPLSEIGDVVCVISGAQTRFVIRRGGGEMDCC
jgi:hypothetical protein